jgi:hypothetical protein
VLAVCSLPCMVRVSMVSSVDVPIDKRVEYRTTLWNYIVYNMHLQNINVIFF